MNVNNLSTLLMNKPDTKQTLEIAKKQKKCCQVPIKCPCCKYTQSTFLYINNIMFCSLQILKKLSREIRNTNVII